MCSKFGSKVSSYKKVMAENKKIDDFFSTSLTQSWKKRVGTLVTYWAIAEINDIPPKEDKKFPCLLYPLPA